MVSVLSATAALLLLIVVIYLFAVWKTLQLTLQCFRAESIAADQVPEYLNVIFEPAIAELKQCGFNISGAYLTDPSIMDSGKDYRILLQNDAPQTYAWVGVRNPLNKENPVSVVFLSFFTDDDVLTTQSDRLPGIFSQAPQEIDQYFSGTSVTEQWELHQRQFEQLCLSKTPQILTPEAFVNTHETYVRTRVEQLVCAGELHWVKKGERYRAAWGVALKAVFKDMWDSFRKKLTFSSPSQAPSSKLLGSEANLTLEIQEFHRRQQQRRSASRRSKRWWLLGSLALFIASCAAFMNPQKLFIFVGVLLLHEGGHVFAMKLFGYRDTAMLFIPFLGALATARKENATLTEKVWISLAGPLPGLILGIGLAIAASLHNTDPEHLRQWYTANDNWMRDSTEILIWLNLFNLLPMYPLDGGQVADLLLFSRNPYLGVAFKSLGVLLLGLLGLTKPLLLAFAVLIALTIPTSFRLAKLNVKLRKESRSMTSTDREELTRYIFTQMQQPAYQSLPFSKKYVLAIGFLDSYKENSAKWTTRFGLFMVYVLSLLVGIVGAIVAFIPNWDYLSQALMTYTQEPSVAFQSRMRQDLNKANQQLQSNPKDIQSYLRKGRAQLGLKDYEGATTSVNQVLQLDAQSSKGYRLRGLIRRRTGDVAGANADQAKGKKLAFAQQLQRFNKQLRDNPNDVEARVWRAHLYLKSGDRSAAMTDVNQALRLDSKDIHALLTRGEIQLQRKNYKAAIADAAQAISLDPKVADAYDLRSRVRHELGDSVGAKTDEEKAQALYEKED